MKRHYYWSLGVATVLCWSLSGGMAGADWIRTFQASDANHLAQVVFDYSSAGTGTLTVKMANLYDGIETNFDSGNNLTAFFYNAGFELDKSLGTATLAPGSSVVKAVDKDGNLAPWTWPVSDPLPGDVGTEFAYSSTLTLAPNGATQGFSSAGLGLFGKHDRFETTYPDDSILWGEASPDGDDFGLIPGKAATVTGASLWKNPLIQKEVWFTFTDVNKLNPNPDSISFVGFQYGTALDPDTFIIVPEPGTIVMLTGLGIFGLPLCGRRRRLNR
jgi:hypothetical protein